MPHLPDLPSWLPAFLIGGVALIVIGVPLKILWEATRSGRERSDKIGKFVDRLRERFSEVAFHRGAIGPSRVSFKHEGRACSIWISDVGEIAVQLDETIGCPFPLVVKTKGRWTPGVAFVGLRGLPRVLTHDPMVDDAVAIYTTESFGGYLRELILDGMRVDGKPSGVAESFVVLRRAPGVRSFRLTAAPGGQMRLRLRLHGEDLLFRPDEMESIVHHLQALYDRLVRD